jgi:hypothetical protein
MVFVTISTESLSERTTIDAVINKLKDLPPAIQNDVVVEVQRFAQLMNDGDELWRFFNRGSAGLAIVRGGEVKKALLLLRSTIEA